jgi:hypothetical protein
VPKTPKSGAGLERNHLPLSAEITCRFRPKSGAGLLRFLQLGVCWRAGAGVGAVVEAAIGERAAQPFVEEENEPGNPGLRRGRL